MQLNHFQIDMLSDGFFSLDGGAMFGIVPKNLWEREEQVDAQNRILMCCNPALIRTGLNNILIDTGVGEKFPDKFNKIYAIDMPRGLIPELKRLGLQPEDIHYVINTHLHFDHCGGNTRLNEKGAPVPTFPNAKYIINRLEWEDALNPNSRSKASYLKDNLVPLAEAKQVMIIDGDAEIVPGVQVQVTGGHTRGHQIVYIKSQGATAVYCADLIPLTSQIRPNWVMAYDLYPVDTVDFKEAFMEKALKEHYLLLFEHSPRIKAGYLILDNAGKMNLQKVDV
jgi:glyoxylase-like metal-dependent hydrolase (beta-lactamase superfamily II)